ncbi:MAG: diaminopimelate epimerase [Promethearchaeota archaeon]
MNEILLENLAFGKYHGLGNDYIILNDIELGIPEEKKSLLAKKLCEVHFSIGADGLIFVCNSENADIRMRIFNDDGSEAEMCGNGIRCFCKYVYEKTIVKKKQISIETLKGIMIGDLTIIDDKVEAVKINMGAPILECDEIPVISTKNAERCIDESLEVLGKTFQFTGVSMGNPHAVIFVDEQFNDSDLIKYGSAIEPHERFPKKINVEFIKRLSKKEAILRVYERGVGVTKSCGTGTCAAVVAGTLLNKFEENAPVVVHNDGGDLTITYTGKTVLMEGPVEKSFEGVIDFIKI